MPITAGLRQLSEGERFRFKPSGSTYVVVRSPEEFRGKGLTCYKKIGSDVIHKLYTNGEKTYRVYYVDASMQGYRDERARTIRAARSTRGNANAPVFMQEVKRYMKMGYKMQDAKKAAMMGL